MFFPNVFIIVKVLVRQTILREPKKSGSLNIYQQKTLLHLYGFAKNTLEQAVERDMTKAIMKKHFEGGCSEIPKTPKKDIITNMLRMAA